jgi:hypothetical protein
VSVPLSVVATLGTSSTAPSVTLTGGISYATRGCDVSDPCPIEILELSLASTQTVSGVIPSPTGGSTWFVLANLGVRLTQPVATELYPARGAFSLEPGAAPSRVTGTIMLGSGGAPTTFDLRRDNAQEIYGMLQSDGSIQLSGNDISSAVSVLRRLREICG